MAENPLDLQPPSEDKPLERLIALAYDIAWGALKKEWTSFFRVANADDHGEIVDNGLREKLRSKWGDYHNHYAVPLLASLGYLRRASTDSEGITHFEVTPKAYALLNEKPVNPPSVFISYKQSQSSALALLVESRLQQKDERISIFIDKNIETSQSIQSRIKEALTTCRYFVCLLAPETLKESQAVRDEIEMARGRTDCIIVPICHNGYTPDEFYEKHLGDMKAITIKHPESAEEYEINLTRLLIKLGYPTT